MWKKIEIENFQSHKNTVMEFVPGVNVIIGESDAGKSVIVNAINWVVKNRPLGDVFRSEWGGSTRVALHAMEGNVVERIRTATKNGYIINNQDQMLKAFGSDVPEDVKNILQMDFANIQEQMNPHFLLQETPGEASRMLNRAAAIDDIDTVTSNLRRNHTKANNDLVYEQGELENHKEQIKRYENLLIIEEELEQAENDGKEWLKKVKRNDNLKQLIIHIKKVRGKIENLGDVMGALQGYETVEKSYAGFQTEFERHQKQVRIVNRVTQLTNIINSFSHVLPAIGVLNKVDLQFMDYMDKEKRFKLLQQVVNKTINIRRLMAKNQMLIEQKETEFKALFPEICPLCGK